MRVLKLWKLISVLHREESGQDALEYVLVLAAVVVVAVAGSNGIATVVANSMTTITGKIQALIH